MAGELPPGPATEVDPGAELRARRRARLRGFQVLLALGVFSAVAGAVLSVSVAFPLRPALQALPPGVREVVVIALWRLWVLAVVPLAAWGAGRVLSLRPAGIAFAIAAWGEALFVCLDLGTVGWAAGVWRSGSWFAGRVLTFGLGTALGWWLARRGRAAAERVKARHEAEAEATRARYARWLEEQSRR